VNQAFAYAFWVQSGRLKTNFLNALDAVVLKQFQLVQNNGKTLVNSAVNGVSFSYTTSNSLEPLDVIQMAVNVIRETKDLEQEEIEGAILGSHTQLTYGLFSTLV